MSEIIEGVVTKVFERTKKKDGSPLRSAAYSICIGDDVWYSCGFTHPGVSEGDLVEFSSKQGKFGKEVVSAVVIQTEAKTEKACTAVVSNNTRQNSIVYQSCLKVAGSLVAAMIATDTLPLPSAKNKKVEAVVAICEKIARELARKALAPVLSEDDKKEEEASEEDE